jgi:hypothetical protein
VIFQLWDWGDGDPPDLNINVELNHYLGFWKRLWLAIKYTFGYLSRYGHYDTMSVRYEDVPRMKAILDEYVRKTDEIVEKDISVSSDL